MKEKKLRIIIGLMTLAVVGLLGIQLYWITRAVDIEKERFYKNVNDALTNIVKKIEKEETAKIIIHRITDGNSTVETCDTISGNGNIYYLSEDETVTIKKPLTPRKPLMPQSPDIVDKHQDTDSLFWINSSSRSENITHNYMIKVDTDSLVSRKHIIFNDLMEELIVNMEHKSIEERLGKERLGGMIREELNEKGINLGFDYAVKAISNDTLSLLSNVSLKDEIVRSPYRIRLFPGEVFTEPNILILHFPEENFYFIRSIQSLLLVSLGLFVLIAGIFYQTAQSLIKQKKITEIKNDLINNITHEFKTPLSTISLTCEALREPEVIKSTETVERYTAIIASEKDRLQKMVEALLNTAMFERDKLKLNLQPVNLHELLKSEAKKYDLVLERLTGKIIYETTAPDDLLVVDKFHLGNVISNLIDNSLKYCNENPRIVISTKTGEKSFLLSIRDNGIGIRKSNIDKVFDTFYRVPTGNIQNVKGFGIGLSYAKKIVEAHRGKIILESEVGKGTVVTIKLPLKGKIDEH